MKRLIALTAVLLFGLPSVAAAQVNTTLDDGEGVCNASNCTLREAVDTLTTITVPPGTYQLTQGELAIDNGLTLTGAGAGSTTIAAASGARVMAVANGVTGVTLTGVRLTGGTPAGLHVDVNTIVTLVRSAVEDSAGDGVVAVNPSSLTLRQSSVTGNSGNGVVVSNGSANVENTTFSANGGAAFASASGNTILRNVTVVGSPALSTTGSGSISMESTLLAGACATPQGLTANTSLATDASCPGTPTASPGLAALALNALGTRNHLLLPGSPAIDAGGAGSCMFTPEDQRGTTRPFGAACDIGAVEYTPADDPPPPDTGGGGPQPPPAPPPDEDDPPVAGKSVDAEPSGTVKVKRPGASRFVALREDGLLPVGTVVDTLKGRVTLTAAGGQTAAFYDGIFKIGQGRGARPLTTLTLVEALSCPKAGRAVAAAKKKKRRLWGDGSGRFRVKGKHSAATVVGTKWLVEDRCTSTLTRVVRGKVSVRDFVKRKTVTVKAGRKYVARAKR